MIPTRQAAPGLTAEARAGAGSQPCCWQSAPAASVTATGPESRRRAAEAPARRRRVTASAAAADAAAAAAAAVVDVPL